MFHEREKSNGMDDRFMKEDTQTSHIYGPTSPLLAMDPSFRVDEGFSEDTRSLDDGDSAMGLEPRQNSSIHLVSNPLTALQNAVLALDESQRSEHAYHVLRTLRTSSIAAIVELLTPLLHIDPLLRLPPEITSQIFSYLPPAVLLDASTVSKAWRARTLDSRLWRHKYLSEGWALDFAQVTKFEDDYKPPRNVTKTLSRKADSQEGGRSLKRRARDINTLQAPISSSTNPFFATRRASGVGDPDDVRANLDSLQDEEMGDAGPQFTMLSPDNRAISFDRMDTQSSTRSFEDVSPGPDDQLSSTDEASSDLQQEQDPAPIDPLVIPVSSSAVRLNFHHIYKQRRKLEDNWTAGRYQSFQLPHRDHPDEAHNECVYTIQYSGKYLVSGSRDKTLRIWNLDTQRLLRRPLSGHKGSVLCLQFDASPKEDLIVSGSSDTDVILWQFSTGNIIRRIHKAHNESVLNLKFDDRFLVTCSKDKLIKVWNRKELKPGDKNYPIRGMEGGAKFPSYIIDLTRIPILSDIGQYLTPEQLEPVKEYSLIMQIDSHSAAVNAVHIYKDQLVSASGDRFLKVFNIHTGANTTVCKGHNKGIACVQYDGKRIVSGSSDDTIRIFDPKSQAEVECLKGHSKLVRTIQASFGDCPGTKEEDLELEAREADKAYFAARRTGEISSTSHRIPHPRERYRTSRRPEDVSVIGAKLPQGGGGSRWARIVSGSYDETVIIWRKAPDGGWVPAHKLQQAEALRAAGAPLLARSARQEHQARQAAQRAAQQQLGQHHPTLIHHQAQPISSSSQPPTTGATATSNLTAALASGSTSQQAQIQPSNSNQQDHTSGLSLMLNHTGMVNPTAQHQLMMNHHQAVSQLHAQIQQMQSTMPNPNLQHHQNILPPHPAAQNARVFKLQFDARRIICCSQDPKIVGWDFANGDQDIIQSSPFFGPPT